MLPGTPISVRGLAQAGALRLLLLALVNALPVAITSTLFLFFVEDKLQVQGMAGPFLILLFLCAGINVPAWAWLNHRIGLRSVPLIAMPLAVAGFVGAAFLDPGSVPAVAAVCVTSGATLGADMVIVPAMFSAALTQAGISASQAFGLWFFAGKLALLWPPSLSCQRCKSLVSPLAHRIPMCHCENSPWPMAWCSGC